MKYTIEQSRINPLSSAAKITLGVLLIFISAQVQIPLKPVPITMHTFGVLLIALIYDKKEAISAMMLYLVLAAFGVPVLSAFSGGVIKFMGPVGGYLVGMMLCVCVVTTMRAKYGDDSLIKLLIYSVIGSISIFLLGIAWLSNLIGFKKAIEFGLIPFIIPGILKALLVASSVRLFKGNMQWLKKKR